MQYLVPEESMASEPRPFIGAGFYSHRSPCACGTVSHRIVPEASGSAFLVCRAAVRPESSPAVFRPQFIVCVTFRDGGPNM